MNKAMAMRTNSGRLIQRIIVVMFISSSAISQAADTELKVGDAFPSLAKCSLEGELPALRKSNIVIVDFWASWCAPCRETFPLLEELHHRFGKQGLIVLAVNEDKSRVAMTEFVKDHPVTFKIVRDAKKKLAGKVNVPALPMSYILDGDGKVLLIESGSQIARDRKIFIKKVEELIQANRKDGR